MVKKVRIHPYFDPNWNSYFIQGLIDIFGFNSIEFSKKGFPKVKDFTTLKLGSLFYFILLEENKKIVIQTDDSLNIDIEAFEWCDIYAKTNYDIEYLKSIGINISKIKPCAPYFPIRLSKIFYNFSIIAKTFDFQLNNYFDYFKKHLYRSYRFNHNLNEMLYEIPSQENYIFFTSSFRRGDVQSNLLRAYFMQVCLEDKSIRFEGGFYPRKDINIPLEFKTLIMKKSRLYNTKEYIKRTKLSVVGFVSPAVNGNYSWRLGEYLAMGKAIIACNNIRKMNVDLIHGVNVHFVEPNFESIKEAFQRLKADKIYREKLEKGAKEYFLKYGNPKSLMMNILK